MTKGFLFLMLLKTWFQRGFQMGAIHFYEVTIDWIVGLMLLLYFILVKWQSTESKSSLSYITANLMNVEHLPVLRERSGNSIQ